jgi:CubicO group peptidase (beta-lactamase class C family)
LQQDSLAGLLGEHARRHAVPGAVIAIAVDGTVSTAAYGVADVRTGEPVTARSRFSPGSLTKSMVAAVIARLADAGRLHLDDLVAQHVPELRGSDWARRATVRDLLANRSGLPLAEEFEFGFAQRTDTDDRALSRLAADLASGEPAASFWSYTNAGWCLLGRVIETATHETWETAMQRHLFDPAGMTETTFAFGPGPGSRVSGHHVTGDGATPVPALITRAYGPAGTSVISTATDLLRFGGLLLDDPLLTPLRDTGAEISIHGWLDAWCLGLARFDWPGVRAWGWDGVINGERSFLRILPDQGAVFVLLTNGSTGRGLYRSLVAELMQARFGFIVPPFELDPPSGTAGDLSRFAGVYAWPDRRVEVTASARGGLVIRTNRGEVEARQLDPQVFVVDPEDPDNPTVTFGAFDEAARPQVLYLMLWGLPRLPG